MERGGKPFRVRPLPPEVVLGDTGGEATQSAKEISPYSQQSAVRT